MKIRHEAPVPPPGKDINQMQTDRAAVDSELALLAVDGYERKAWVGNPYFDRKEDFVGSGLPTFLVCRLDGLTADTCLRLVTEPAEVEKKGLWGWAVVDGAAPTPRGTSGWTPCSAACGKRESPFTWMTGPRLFRRNFR